MSKEQANQSVVPPILRELFTHAHAIDRVLHHNPIRRQIVTWLLLEDEISFKELQRRTRMTSGNLGHQLGLLEQAGYLEVIKTFQEQRPRTSYRLSPAGLAAWETYLEHMDALLAGLQAIGKLKQSHWPGDERVSKGEH